MQGSTQRCWQARSSRRAACWAGEGGPWCWASMTVIMMMVMVVVTMRAQRAGPV